MPDEVFSRTKLLFAKIALCHKIGVAFLRKGIKVGMLADQSSRQFSLVIRPESETSFKL